MNIKKPSILKDKNALLSFGIFVVLFGIYCFYFNRTQYISTDNVSSFLLLVDWLEGNTHLNDWIISTSNFLFTDVFWCLPGLLLGIPMVTIVCILVSMFHAGMLSIFLYILLDYASKKNYIATNKQTLFVTIVYLLLSATIPYSSEYHDSPTYIYLMLNGHKGAWFLIAIDLLILYKWIMSGYKGKVLPVLHTVIGALVVMSDSYSLLVFYGPVLAYSVYVIIWPKLKHDYKNESLLLICSVINVGLGILLNKLIPVFTGIRILGVRMRLSTYPDLRHNAKLSFFRLLHLYGFDYLLGDRRVFWFFIALILLLLMCVAVIYQIIRALMARPNRLELLLTAGIVVNILGAIVITTDTGLEARYLLSVPSLGPMLLILTILSINKPKLKMYLMVFAAVISTIFGVKNIIDSRKAENLGENHREVAEYIESHNLGNGYGGFWSSSNISLYTNLEHRVYPIYWFNWGEGFYHPVFYYQPEWYDEEDMHYVVLFSEEGCPLSTKAYKSEWMLFAGEPDEDIVIGRYEILYYEEDLHQYLRPSPEESY